MTNPIVRDSETSEMEDALKLVFHIQNPCSVDVNGKREDIRAFYLREAERALPSFTASYVRDFLRLNIDLYTPKVL